MKSNKITINKDEATLIIKLAQKLIVAIEEEVNINRQHNEQLRKSEDQYDMTDSSKPRPGNCECCDG
jgi:hypothetical protein